MRHCWSCIGHLPEAQGLWTGCLWEIIAARRCRTQSLVGVNVAWIRRYARRHTHLIDLLLIYYSLQPNGLRVLGLIPGLVEKLEGKELDEAINYSIVEEDKGFLASSDLPSTFDKRYGYKMTGIRRPVLLRLLVDTAKSYGVPIIWGHHLESLKQDQSSVTVHFANGNSDTASFVVGCDGLHSNTRACLFGSEKATFTGVVQVSHWVSLENVANS